MPWRVAMTVDLPGIPVSEEPYRRIGAEFARRLCRSEDEVIAFARDADAVVGGMHFTRRVIESLPKLRLVAFPGIGYDPIDVQAATGHGVLVTNNPDYCVEEVSDHTMALILACGRKVVRLVDAVRAGKWDSIEKPEIRYRIMPPMGRLRGQTLGLVGFGRIPRALVPKAKGLGLRIIAYDPYVPHQVAEGLGVEMVDFDRLLKESDFISVHAALTPENRHMFGLDEFKKMKPTAYLINTARGGLVDHDALQTALTQGYVAGAALDVFEPEPPPPSHPLLNMEKVIVTAHSANFSDQAMIDLFAKPAEEVVRVLSGQWPRALVNPQAKEKYVAKWGEMR